MLTKLQPGKFNLAVSFDVDDDLGGVH